MPNFAGSNESKRLIDRQTNKNDSNEKINQDDAYHGVLRDDGSMR